MTSADTIFGGVRTVIGGAPGEFDRHVAAATAPVRIEVTGRAGVGRTSLVDALGPIPGADVVESEPWDRPGAADPILTGDVIVLVVLDPPREADRAAAAAGAGRLLPVLAKADTVTDPQRALARAAAVLGTPCLPVTTAGADTALARLRAALDERVPAIQASRAGALLTRLRASAQSDAQRELVEEFLATDDGVRLMARATGEPVVGAEALERARQWRTRMQSANGAHAMRAALALHRDAVREWARGD